MIFFMIKMYQFCIKKKKKNRTSIKKKRKRFFKEGLVPKEIQWRDGYTI